MTFESESESGSVMSNSLRPHGLYSPWNSPGQNTGLGSLSLLQGIFPTQGSNPSLPYCGRILYQLSHKRSPRIPEWVAYPFSRRSSWPRNQTRVSCIAGGFFTKWATREAPFWPYCEALGMLVTWPGIEPMPPAQSLNHWDAREVPILVVLNRFAYALISSFF